MYQGGCLCGQVRFEIHGPIRNIVMCHCSQCRKAQGSAYATNGVVDVAEFVITQGEQDLSSHAVNDKQTRYFCRLCGSPVMSRNSGRPDVVRIRLGTIESPIDERPSGHIFVDSRANWDEIHDNLPQYPEYEPGRMSPSPGQD